MFTVLPSSQSARPVRRFQRWFAGTLALTLSLASLPAFAADPFRASNPHNIGDASEAAFTAMFKDGNYPEAKQLITKALSSEPDEPMVQAMAGSVAYLDQNWSELQRRAQLTQEKAKNLMDSDPLRGNMYMAVGIFLEGGYVLQTQGIAGGTPTALRMLQQVFHHLSEAEKINRDDPELSLLKGFMDLLLAVNLPFSNPDQAIARLRNGAPTYLANRGIAIGLRDLGRYDDALKEVDTALKAAPNNPDLIYLKAQISRLKGDNAASLPLYNKALQYANQMPNAVVRDVRWEQCIAEGVDGPTCTARVGG